MSSAAENAADLESRVPSHVQLGSMTKERQLTHQKPKMSYTTTVACLLSGPTCFMVSLVSKYSNDSRAHDVDFLKVAARLDLSLGLVARRERDGVGVTWFGGIGRGLRGAALGFFIGRHIWSSGKDGRWLCRLRRS